MHLSAIDHRILRLAVPSIVSNITVPLIGLVDLAIAGHLGSVASIGAIAVGTMAFNLIYWIFGFLRMGTSGLTAQALGTHTLDETVRLLLRSLCVGLAVALLILFLQVPLRKLLFLAMHPSHQVAPLAAQYFHIVVWGAPAMLCQYGLTGWFIGMQNTRTPMLVAISQNVANVVASLLFVVVCGWGLRGVAYGTLCAQWFGLFLALYVLFSRYARLRHYDWHTALFSHVALSRFFRVNRDIFLRTLCLIAVNLFFLSAGSREGDLVLSANAVLMTFFTIFSYFMDGFAYAAEALSGRSFGANHVMADSQGAGVVKGVCSAAFRCTVNRLFRWGIAMVVIFSFLYVIGGKSFLYLLTDQQAVIHTARTYFGWVLLIPVAGFAAFIYDGVFIGMTATRSMLLSSAVSMVFFFALYLLLQGIFGNNALWFAFLVYLASRGLIQHLLYFNARKKGVPYGTPFFVAHD